MKLLYTATLLAILSATACRKTEYQDVKRPYQSIESFSINGYGDLGTVNAAIKGDSVIIYWNDKAERPAKIKPVIALGTGATISPASGQEVDFADGVAYTVTAEDGTTKKYYLRPVFNTAIPVLFSMPETYRWAQTTPLNILGEYFMSGGNVENIKVYARRERDGFEFDLPIDATQTSATKITVSLPEMTNVLDTGLHRIYVKVGDFASNSMAVKLTPPALFNDPLNITSVTIGSPQQPLKLGDSLTMTWNIKGMSPEMFEKFNPKSNISSLALFLQDNFGNYELAELQPGDYTARGNQMNIFLGDAFSNFVGYYPSLVSISRSGIEGQSGSGGEFYIVGGENAQIRQKDGTIPNNDSETGGTVGVALAQPGQPVKFGQEMRLNYTFSSTALKEQYAGNSSVEVIFRSVAAGSNGGYFFATTIPATDHGDYATFSVSSDFQSSLQHYAIYGIKTVHASKTEPTKYLKSSVLYADVKMIMTP